MYDDSLKLPPKGILMIDSASYLLYKLLWRAAYRYCRPEEVGAVYGATLEY